MIQVWRKKRDDQEDDIVLVEIRFNAVIASNKYKLYITAFRSDVLMFRTNTSENKWGPRTLLRLKPWVGWNWWWEQED